MQPYHKKQLETIYKSIAENFAQLERCFLQMSRIMELESDNKVMYDAPEFINSSATISIQPDNTLVMYPSSSIEAINKEIIGK